MVGGISILVKLVGFYKETVVAAAFGISELLDTYLIAVLIPTFVQNVFVSSLNQLFIPNYIIELKTSQKGSSFQTISFMIVTGLVLLLTFGCLLFTEYALETVFPSHDPSYYHLIRKQFYWALPCLLIWGYSSLMSAILEVNGKFLNSSIAPILISVFTIICLVFFKEELGDLVLVIGLLSGTVASFLYKTFVCLYHGLLHLGHPALNDNIRMMVRQLPPKITSSFLSGANTFVDNFFAAQLVVGSISALNYGVRIPAFTVSMIMLPLGNVLLPHFSRAISENLTHAYKQFFKVLKVIFTGAALVTALAIVFSHDIIRLLFERKEFTADHTQIVGDLQQIALLYIPFYLCTLVTVKFLTAINKNGFMAWTSLWNLALNLLLNIVFVKFYGVYGLVLSTTVVYIISSFIYVGFSYKQFKKHLV